MWLHENSVVVTALKILFLQDSSVVLSDGFIEDNANPETCHKKKQAMMNGKFFPLKGAIIYTSDLPS